MDKLEEEAIRQYRLWMEHLKVQREDRGIKKQKDVAKAMSISESYANKIENTQTVPSVMVNLFKYLIANGFDLSPLYKVRIRSSSETSEEEKKEFIKRIREDFDEDLVAYLIEMSEVVQMFRVPTTKK